MPDCAPFEVDERCSTGGRVFRVQPAGEYRRHRKYGPHGARVEPVCDE